MILLLDFGNSQLKWSVISKQSHIRQLTLHTLPYSAIEQVKDTWQSLAIEQITISSVTPHHLNDAIPLLKTITQNIWLAYSTQQAFGVTNGYDHPHALGIDRWLALIAAKHHYPHQALCLVDCGTAMTVDVMDECGFHQGGLICAGLTTMKKALTLHTAQLDFSHSLGEFKLAHETQQAISNGALMSVCSMIDQLGHWQDKKWQVIISGGDAPFISGFLSRSFILESNLVLQGLGRIVQAQDYQDVLRPLSSNMQ